MPLKTNGSGQPVVLILEDDELTSEGLALLVRDAGYEPAVFKSLGEANESVAAVTEVSAIISDFDLDQGPNGVEAALALRADRTPQPPVLIVSGTRLSRIEAVARAAGFEMSTKPASPSFLRRWLARNAAAQGPAPLPQQR
jgi:DNA-binding response OmpR family regulator